MNIKHQMISDMNNNPESSPKSALIKRN